MMPKFLHAMGPNSTVGDIWEVAGRQIIVQPEKQHLAVSPYRVRDRVDDNVVLDAIEVCAKAAGLFDHVFQSIDSSLVIIKNCDVNEFLTSVEACLLLQDPV